MDPFLIRYFELQGVFLNWAYPEFEVSNRFQKNVTVPKKFKYSDCKFRGERIIRYSNILRILEPNTSIRIRIWVTFLNRILFVFVFG